MADGEFDVDVEVSHCLVEFRKVKQRVVAEAADAGLQQC
jgi:hypothetical protein